MHELTLKLNLENRNRRSNLRLAGLPEKAENGDAEEFLQKWLPEVLGPDTFLNPVITERAHRLPGQQAPNTPPVFLSWSSFKTRCRWWEQLTKKVKWCTGNKHIMFLPDLSAEVQKQRKLYNGVKRQLWELNIDFGLIFPAKMRIFHQGGQHLLYTPAEVDNFIQRARQQKDG